MLLYRSASIFALFLSACAGHSPLTNAQSPAPQEPAQPEPASEQAAPKMEINQVAEGVFVASFNYCNSLIVIGTEGVLVVDTYNPYYASTLKAEIAKLTDLPVKYLVYSHAHRDHLGGAELVVGDGQIVGQRRQLRRLEFISEKLIPKPDILFDDEYRIDLGGVTVRLHDQGPDHASGITVVEVEDRGVITVFDLAYKNRWRWPGMPDESPRRVAASLDQILEMDFHTAVAGHGPNLSREDVAMHAAFLEDLISQTRVIFEETIAAGLSPLAGIARAKREIDTSAYEDWGMIDNRESNIVAIYNSLLQGY